MGKGFRNRSNVFILWAMFAAFVAGGCGREVPVIESPTEKERARGVDFARANGMLAQKERREMEIYGGRRGWRMEEIGMGIKVMRTEEGHGAAAEEGDTAIVAYTVRNIADKEVYKDVKDTVVIGRLKPTAGVDLALRTLKEGSRAWVMIPSDLAYGVPGDGDRIGTRWVLIIDLKVEEIKNLKIEN